MKWFYVDSRVLQVSGNWARATLSKNDAGQVRWCQDFEHRHWDPIAFISPNKALEYIRDLYKENGGIFYLDVDDTKIMTVDGEQVVPTDMVITRDW